MFYVFDSTGAILSEIASRPGEVPEGLVYVEVDQEPPGDFIDPRWINGQWVEGASSQRRRQAVDEETFYFIKDWCTNQGKCEEYYLNRGVQDKEDSEFQSYRSERASIIRLQALKKAGIED